MQKEEKGSHHQDLFSFVERKFVQVELRLGGVIW